VIKPNNDNTYALSVHPGAVPSLGAALWKLNNSIMKEKLGKDELIDWDSAKK
jgi:hypothetical protein